MNGTVVEVVDMKVEDQGEEHLDTGIHDQASEDQPRPKRRYPAYTMDVIERQCVDEELIEEVRKHSCIYDPSHMYARDSFLKETTWRQIASNLNVSTEYCKLRWKSLRDRFVKTQKEERRRKESGIHKLVRPYRFAKQLSFLKDYTRTRRHGLSAGSFRDQQQPSEDEELIPLSEAVRDDDDEGGSIEAGEQGWAAADGSISSPSSHHTNSDNVPQQHSADIRRRSPRKRHQVQIPADEYVMNYLGLGAKDSPAAKQATPGQSSTSVTEAPEVMNYASSPGDDAEQKYDEVLHFLVSLAPAMRRLPAQKQSLARIKIQTVLHELEFSGN